MESSKGVAKRKRSEESSFGVELVKKSRLEVVIPKLSVSKDLLERLQKFSWKQKDEPKDESSEQNSSSLSSSDVQVQELALPTVQEQLPSAVDESVPPSLQESMLPAEPGSLLFSGEGLLSTTVRESPMRHRLSNLLDGVLPDPDDDKSTVPPDCGSENVASINYESNHAEQFSNLVSAKARLFDIDGVSSENDGILALVQDEGCYHSDVVNGTCLLEGESVIRSSSSTDCTKDYADAASGMKRKHSGDEVTEHIDELEVSKEDTVLEGPVCDAGNSCEVSENGLSSINCLPKIDVVPDEEVDSHGGSGCRAISGSSVDSSVDFATGYDTLEVINNMLSDLTQERTRRAELEKRITLIENENEELKMDAEKLKALVDDLLHHPKAKADTVSRGTQINTNLSLRRGRTVNRATSPIKKRDPSPDITLLRSSVGCQTSPYESPRQLISSFCQTDEELIPPKIMMSMASQTDLSMPIELRWVLSRTTPRPAVSTSRGQSMVIPNSGPTATAQLASSIWRAPASNLQTAYSQSVQASRLSLGALTQQTQALLAVQHGQLPRPVTSVNPTYGLRYYPATASQTGGLPLASYFFGALNSTQARTTQPFLSQRAHMPAINYNQITDVLPNQTSNYQAPSQAASNSSMGAFDGISQRTTIPQSQLTNQAFCRNGVQVARNSLHMGQHQPAGTTATFQITPDSEAISEIRRNVAVQQASQEGIVGNHSSRNFSSSRVSHQQSLQSLSSQQETQVLTQLVSQGNALSGSQTSQRAHLNSLRAQSHQAANLNSPMNPAVRVLSGSPLQPSVSPSLATPGHIQGKNARLSHYEGANLTLPLSQSPTTCIQQAYSQPRALNTQLNTHRTPLLVNQQEPGLHLSRTPSATGGLTTQQPVSHASVASSQVIGQRNPAALLQNQNERNLNSTLCQTTVSQVTVQPSVLLPSNSASVQIHSSKSCHNAIEEFKQIGERNKDVSRNQPSTRSSGPNLCEEVKRVYNELQRSLDEVTANKQRERSASVATDSSNSVIQSGILASTNQACVSGEANLNLSISSRERRDSDKEQMSCSSDSNIPYRKPSRTPNGTLEDAVQRLLALQNNASSSANNFRSSTPKSVDELFEGISEEGKSGESRQTGLAPSEGTTVSHQENNPENKRVLEPVAVTEGAEASSSCEEDSSKGQGTRDHLGVDNDLGGTAESDGASAENKGDSVFVAPTAPLKSKGERNKDKNTHADDLDAYLMSPVIPQMCSASLLTAQASGMEWNTIDNDSTHPENNPENVPVLEPVTAMQAEEASSSCEDEGTRDVSLVADTDDGGAAESGGGGAENKGGNVFVVPSTPLKSRGEKDKDNQAHTDDMYAYLMSPVIPQMYPARRVSAQMLRLEKNTSHNDSPHAVTVHEDQESCALEQNANNMVRGGENEPKRTGAGDTVRSEEDLLNTFAIADTHESVLGVNHYLENKHNDPGVVESSLGTRRPVVDRDNACEDKETDPRLCNLRRQQGFVDGRKDEGRESAEPTEEKISERLLIERIVSNVGTLGEKGPEFGTCQAKPHELVEAGDYGDVDMESDAVSEQQPLAKTSHALNNTVDVGPENVSEIVPEVVDGEIADSDGKADKAMITEHGSGSDLGLENDGIPDFESSTGEGKMVSIEKDLECHESMDGVEQPVAKPGESDANDSLRSAVVKGNFNCEECGETENEHGAETLSVLKVPDANTGHSEFGLGVLRTEESMNAQHNPDEHQGSDGGALKVRSSSTLDETVQAFCGDSSPGNQVKSSGGPCVNGEVHLDDRTKSERHHNSGLQSQSKPEDNINSADSTSKKDVTLNNLSPVTQVIRESDIEGIVKQLSEHDDHMQTNTILRYLAIEDSNGKQIADIPACPNTNTIQNEKENASSSPELQYGVNSASKRAVPRLIARVVNSDLVVMWDLPPDNKVTDIDCFQLYSWTLGGQWVRIAEIKALKLPMGCTLKHLKPGKTFVFKVRAVFRDGVLGQYSQPSGEISV